MIIGCEYWRDDYEYVMAFKSLSTRSYRPLHLDIVGVDTVYGKDLRTRLINIVLIDNSLLQLPAIYIFYLKNTYTLKGSIEMFLQALASDFYKCHTVTFKNVCKKQKHNNYCKVYICKNQHINSLEKILTRKIKT